MRIFVTILLAPGWATIAVGESDQIQQQMAEMRAQIQFMQSQMEAQNASMQKMQSRIYSQTSVIENLHSRLEMKGELHKEVRQLHKDVYEQRSAVEEIRQQQHGNQTLEDAMTLHPETYHRGNSFFVKAGITNDPFQNGTGWLLGGVMDLKLADLGAGSLLGEIGLTYSRSKENKDVVTSDVLGQLVNQELRLNTISIDIGFKYRLDNLGEPGSWLRRFQPYARLGFAIQVFISDSDSIIAGQVPQAQELENRNVPAGQGNLYTALSVGGGLEFMVTRSIFIGFDYSHYELFTEHGYSDTFSITTGLRY